MSSLITDQSGRSVLTAIIYRITYPNGKIYIGQDRTNSINYFGSASDRLISRDFSPAQRRSFTVTRDILWESVSATRGEINRKEVELILLFRANDPAVGYNQFPRFKRAAAEAEKPSDISHASSLAVP